MSYLYYFFDFDYTLVDSSKGIVVSFNNAFKEMGYATQKPEDIKKTIGQSLEDAFCYLTGSDNYDECLNFRRYFMENSKKYMADYTVLLDGVDVVLSKIKEQHKKIAIVSSKDHFTIEKVCRQNGIFQYIDIIVGEDDVSEQKPNPESVFLAAKKFNADCSEILYIGDSVWDAQTAQNARLDFLPVISGTTSPEQFDKYSKIGILSDIYGLNSYI